ncbi:MAG: hypothetical protein H9535_08240 [Ignavibacteria bacterium]|nr:hypothetical protein [Ignavibacteria bacterium]
MKKHLCILLFGMLLAELTVSFGQETSPSSATDTQKQLTEILKSLKNIEFKVTNATVQQIEQHLKNIEFRVTIATVQQIEQQQRENEKRRNELQAKLLNEYAVPDIPATKILDVQPDNILRPTTPKALAVSIAQAASNTGLGAIPAAIALEFSPYIFIKNGLPSQKSNYFQDNNFLNNLRVSLATTSEAQTRAMAFGVRYTVIDEVNKSQTAECNKMFGLFTNIADKNFDKGDIVDIILARKYGKNVQEYKRMKNDFSLYDSLYSKENKEYLKNVQESDLVLSVQLEAEKQIDSLFNILSNDTLWSNNILDIGFAVRGSSSDSLFSSFQLRQAQFWGTYAVRSSSKLQIVVGANIWYGIQAAAKESDKNKLGISGAARLYYGANALKIFGDITASYYSTEEQSGRFSIALGIEARINENIWLELSASGKYQYLKFPIYLPIATVRYGIN